MAEQSTASPSATPPLSESSHQTFTTDLLFSPSTSAVPPKPQLTDDQISKLKIIQGHFAKDDFQLPIKETCPSGDASSKVEKSILNLREMMFLVRFCQLPAR